MSLRHLVLFRRISTSSIARRPKLSDNYKSQQLWDERFNCKLIGDNNMIRSINNKIIMGDELNNLEVDIFINIASAETNEIAQLQESARLLKNFRKSLYAHALLPSTHHAFCRLFLDSNRLPSLISILEDRVRYGIFADLFAMNLLLDEALDKKNYAVASRLAVLVMLQEEFGMNRLTDSLSLYALASYVESKTNFDDWVPVAAESDPILLEPQNDELETSDKKEEAKKGAQEDEEEEEDVQYVRIPFLRNPYNDNHFDITNPRLLCGKTLSMLSKTIPKDNVLRVKTSIIGDILQGHWYAVEEAITKLKNMQLGKVAEVCEYYIENLHDINGPNEEQKKTLLSSLKQSSGGKDQFSESVESYFTNLSDNEIQDIDQLRVDISSWSELRLKTIQAQEDKKARDELIAVIRAKKEELRLKEQYLYFYDNLKKSRVTRIEYK